MVSRGVFAPLCPRVAHFKRNNKNAARKMRNTRAARRQNAARNHRGRREFLKKGPKRAKYYSDMALTQEKRKNRAEHRQARKTLDKWRKRKKKPPRGGGSGGATSTQWRLLRSAPLFQSPESESSFVAIILLSFSSASVLRVVVPLLLGWPSNSSVSSVWWELPNVLAPLLATRTNPNNSIRTKLAGAPLISTE